MSDAEAQMQSHDEYDLIEEQFNRELDESLHPSGPGSLFGYVAEMRLPGGGMVVDAGCGEGEHAVELATRFGFQVTGVDPVLRLVQTAQRNPPPGCPVTAGRAILPGAQAHRPRLVLHGCLPPARCRKDQLQ